MATLQAAQNSNCSDLLPYSSLKVNEDSNETSHCHLNLHYSSESLVTDVRPSVSLAVGEMFNPDPLCSLQYSEVLKLARKFNKFYLTGAYKNCLPFVIEGRQIGLILQNVLEAMKNHRDVFVIEREYVSICGSLNSYVVRSNALAKVLESWRKQEEFVTLKGWRNECFEIRGGFSEKSFLEMERSATCLFGVRQFGVDINGYVKHPELGVSIWLQRRSKTKPTWPGKLDNMVGGGLTAGSAPLITAIAEAAEEASIPPELIKHLKPAGTVSFLFESERGIFPNIEFVYDLELPSTFVPTNADGEVESFELVPIRELLAKVLSADFKTTSCPVVLDFLVRHGYINSEN
ncbi:hypothetical protein QYM36_003157, partial [Artemia franciscana]